MWDAANGMLDLNDSVVDLAGWNFLDIAAAINNNGDIMWSGIISSGERRALPSSGRHESSRPAPEPEPEPEPLSLLWFGTSILGLCAARGRR